MLSPTTIALATSAALLLGSALLPTRAAPPSGAVNQPPALEQWGFDPSILVADSRELLVRAPDGAIDRLFQAVHASTRTPAQSQALCALFDPAADRSLAGLNEIAGRFEPAQQEQFATAIAQLFVAAMQSPPQPYDPSTARQALKAAGVRAALVNDGFVAGLNGADHDARCRSIGWLLDEVRTQPLQERAAVTRLLLGEGLDHVAAGVGGQAGDRPR